MTVQRVLYPFTALVGQETMKQALVLNAINPSIGGVLIRGEKGTAKSTAVRALARLLPELEVHLQPPRARAHRSARYAEVGHRLGAFELDLLDLAAGDSVPIQEDPSFHDQATRAARGPQLRTSRPAARGEDHGCGDHRPS